MSQLETAVAESAIDTSDAGVASILRSYPSDDPEVPAFLEKNPDVCDALLRAKPLILSVFGMDATASLVVAPGFDGSEDDRISCHVYAGDDIDEELDKLSALLREWQDMPLNAADKMSFDI